MSLKLMYITNDVSIAKIAQEHGVDRIWVDLETEGKEERQKNRDSVKSHHTVEDVARLSKVLDRSELLVRINPWSTHSVEEVEQVVAAGADMIMLPMWKSVAEVQAFLKAVAGRTKTTLLLETKEAVACVDAVLQAGGFDEIHIGLNDLHISYGMSFMFEPLANGLVEELCGKFKQYGIPYGFGGIARIGEGLLPAEKIIYEHYRLGSTRAILSRTFCDIKELRELDELDRVFTVELKKLHDLELDMKQVTGEAFENNRLEVVRIVDQVAECLKKRG